MSTSIQVDDETWRRLNQRKGRGDSFDDVVNELLGGISGDAHDRLLWFRQDGESLSDALDRVTAVMPGPAQFRDAGVDPERLDEQDFVLEHIRNEDGIYEPRVFRNPYQVYKSMKPVIEETDR